MNKLKVHNIIKLIIILYIGISPALVNAALSLFSEIIMLPLVVLLILLNMLAWQTIQSKEQRSVDRIALAIAICFVVAAFGKAIYQYIFFIFLIPYVFLALLACIQKNKEAAKKAIWFIAITLIITQTTFWGFKKTNEVFNGDFAFTNRGAELFYGNAAKRTGKISQKVFLAHIASVPGAGVCRKFFDDATCKYAEFHQADLARSSINTVLPGVPDEQYNTRLYVAGFKHILKSPFQYMTLMLIESLRMPFWESTKIGFVGYPDWLQQIYDTDLFGDGIRLFTSLFTIVALFLGIMYFSLGLRHMFDLRGSVGEGTLTMFFVMVSIISYTTLYALFSILTRYSLVIAPLYLILIAHTLNIIIFKIRKSSQ